MYLSILSVRRLLQWSHMSVEVGTQNKLISYDIKAGIACTSVLFKGVGKASKPILETFGSKGFIELDRKREKLERYVHNRFQTARFRRGA